MHRKLKRVLGYLFDHPVVVFISGKRANKKYTPAYTVTTYNYRILLWNGGDRFPSLLSLTRLRGLRHSKITQFSAGEIIQPPMNLDIAPFQCVLDRIRLGEVLELLSHILPHQERKCFRLIQRIDLERSSEVGERR